MKQHEQVIKSMEQNGGYATFNFLNQNVDTSKWKTKTPFATIRRIVQDQRFFFKIKPGLWALKDFKDKLPANILELIEEGKDSFDKEKKYTHYYYQGIISEIGNLNQHSVYTPAQDRNKPFLNRKLKDVTTLDSLPQFTFLSIMKTIKSIDVIWINSRKFPLSVFEVENSTDFKNSLTKFYELIDFSTDMVIVSDIRKYQQFLSVIGLSIFNELKGKVIFCDYSSLDEYYSNPYKYQNFKQYLGKN